jgi:hypothetical protein
LIVGGMWEGSHGDSTGLIAFGAGILSFLTAQRLTTDIRMVRLADTMELRPPVALKSDPFGGRQ